jgi:hypothetical protein
MAISLSDEIRQLLDRANFAHLATLMPYGLDAREIGLLFAQVKTR